MDFKTFTITKDDNDRRLDRVLRRFFPKMSLTAIYVLVRKGLIRVDGKKVSPDFHVREGSVLGIVPVLLDSVRLESEPVKSDFIPEILLETADILFINKTAGIAVHGEGCLDQLIPQTIASSRSLSFRTGPLHRLDKDTSGILAFSRSLEGARWFSAGVCSHVFEKYYLGIIEGFLENDAEWKDCAEDGKEMITRVTPLAKSKNTVFPLTLVRFQIITGRKHQIRIQSSLHGHPLFGDSRYGSKGNTATYYLHAWQMVFPPDRLNGIPEKIIAPLSERYSSFLRETFAEYVLAHIEHGDLYWMQHEEH